MTRDQLVAILCAPDMTLSIHNKLQKPEQDIELPSDDPNDLKIGAMRFVEGYPQVTQTSLDTPTGVQRVLQLATIIMS